jgi:hypothetical protein
MYGVWIANIGWWKLPPSDRAYSTFRLEEAEHYAGFVGGVVKPIDQQLEAGEQAIKTAEYNHWTRRLRRWIIRK